MLHALVGAPHFRLLLRSSGGWGEEYGGLHEVEDDVTAPLCCCNFFKAAFAARLACLDRFASSLARRIAVWAELTPILVHNNFVFTDSLQSCKFIALTVVASFLK